jgi:hypothetical protein
MIQPTIKSITEALPPDIQLDRDTALDYYESSLRDHIRGARERAKADDLHLIDLLIHARAEVRLARDSSKAEVKVRMDTLKLIPDDDEEAEFRDASLLILNEIGKTLSRQ